MIHLCKSKWTKSGKVFLLNRSHIDDARPVQKITAIRNIIGDKMAFTAHEKALN